MILKRFEQTSEVTRGVLIMDGKAIALTLENPWLNNKRNVSCIPFGIYRCKRIVSPKFNETFEVTGVRGRSNILFHSGNTEPDTEGCIILGSGIGQLNGLPAVFNSRKTRAEFMALTAGLNEFSLSVVNV